MPIASSVIVDDVEIPYRLRRSSRARRLRIVITPGQVEVVAPLGVETSRAHAFVESRGRWLYEKTRALRERSLEPLPREFVDGSEVLFEGRRLRLRVEAADVAEPSLRHAAELRLRLPRGLATDERAALARERVTSWLAERALATAGELVRRWAPELGKGPRSLRIGDQKTLWGSCSPRDVISLNWRLIAAPPEVFEYVVVHELCHLRQRNHGPRFWRLVEKLLPDYRERRAWLKEHGVGLG